ncbi:uncharacterized protein LOC141727138 [Zonotrichia albicollis]|uniref:uncharacterized protein LOC141727138 n=1 Tax=Zonotrichia albicollis TaxID=44394 RepID=UPI003D80CF7A
MGNLCQCLTVLLFVCHFIKRIQDEEATGAGLRPFLPIFQSKSAAALLAMLVEEDLYKTKQAPVGPSRVLTQSRPGRAAPRHCGCSGSTWPSASSPRQPGASRCWPRLRALQAGEGRGWGQAAPGPGPEPAPTLPSCCSLQLAEDRSRAAEHLRRALCYLQSPQEPLREAAVSFMGMAGRHLRGQQQELQLICSALEEMAYDSSPAIRNAAIESCLALRAVQRAPYSRWHKLRDQLRSAWKKRPRLRGNALLFCCSSPER